MPVRVGLVGCGGMAGGHIENWARMRDQGEEVVLAAFCDVDAGRAERYATRFSARAYTDFLSRIGRTRAASLNVAHVSLPHAPWWYLPSGRQASVGATPAPGRDDSTDTWREPSLTLQAYQRHLLQVVQLDGLPLVVG